MQPNPTPMNRLGRRTVRRYQRSAVEPPTDVVLPIEPVLPDLRAALRERPEAVLQAPPGAGKTTLVPPALLEEDWLEGRRIILLEPRRLAARAAAAEWRSFGASESVKPWATAFEWTRG